MFPKSGGMENPLERKCIRVGDLPAPKDRFTHAIRYGRWVFLSGVSAADFDRGLVAEVIGNEALPLAGEDPLIREAQYVLATMGRVLQESGSDLQSLIRIDQFPTSRAMIDPYHVARKQVLKAPRPASTSVDIEGLLCPQAHIEIDGIAAIETDGFRKEGITTDKIPEPIGGYAPAIRIGDWVFLAGQIPTDFRTGIASEADVHPEFWEGNKVDRQTRFTLRNMQLTLEAAGSSLSNVVKAQVYLTDINDLPRMERVWREFFPSEPPARTVYPVRSLGVAQGRIEINFIALVDAGKTRKETIVASGARQPLFHEPHAVRAGEFVFLSGLLAASREGLVREAHPKRGYPYDCDVPGEQMRDILQQAEIICRAAGTDLSAALRMFTVHTDLREHGPASRIRDGFFSNGQPARTSIEVKAPLQVPGSTILVDLLVASSA